MKVNCVTNVFKSYSNNIPKWGKGRSDELKFLPHTKIYIILVRVTYYKALIIEVSGVRPDAPTCEHTSIL